VCAEAPREPTVLRKPATDATHTRVTHILLNLVLSLLQHDPPNRPATDALDAGDEFRLARPTAAAVVAHSIKDGTDRHVTLRRSVRLVEQALAPAHTARTLCAGTTRGRR